MARKKPQRQRTQTYESYTFEVLEWEPTYSLSVNRDLRQDEVYSEYAELHIQTVCAEPEPFKGRATNMILSSRRNFHKIDRTLREPDWRPNCIGLLSLRADRGSFYAGVPQETINFLAGGLAHGKFRYVMLSGPSLYRRESMINSIHLMRTLE